MIDFPENKKIILFDGVCNLCNEAVRKAIKYDRQDIFLYTSLQSNTGKQIISHLNIDISKIDSIILFEPNIAYHIKSSAAIKIMETFGGFWNLSKLGWIFPKIFRDAVYSFIAKNRYRWFGKKNECMIPTPELQAKFLD